MDIVVCDDKKEICELLTGKVGKICPDAAVRCCQSGEELLGLSAAVRCPDILFMDIEMPGVDGMELAKRLRRMGWKCILIFVTAYADYVFDAFDVGAFHYLVKPVSDEKLRDVLGRAVRQLKEREASDTAQGTDAGDDRVIMVKSGGVSTSIRVSDITYAEVYNRKVVIHTKMGSVEYYGKLRDLKKELGTDFYRPHRAYLVHFRHITKYDTRVIYMGDEQALMAKENYAGFVSAYLAYMKKANARMPKNRID